jgi:hypothetical protein
MNHREVALQRTPINAGEVFDRVRPTIRTMREIGRPSVVARLLALAEPHGLASVDADAIASLEDHKGVAPLGAGS